MQNLVFYQLGAICSTEGIIQWGRFRIEKTKKRSRLEMIVSGWGREVSHCEIFDVVMKRSLWVLLWQYWSCNIFFFCIDDYKWCTKYKNHLFLPNLVSVEHWNCWLLILTSKLTPFVFHRSESKHCIRLLICVRNSVYEVLMIHSSDSRSA